MKLRIEIDTPPQGRPRFTRQGIAYDPPESRKFKAQFSQLVMAKLTSPPEYTGALKVTLAICRPARAFPKKGVLSKKFGDIDNLAKIVLDALTATGAIWRDDSQIVELSVVKAVADSPRVDLEIEEV